MAIVPTTKIPVEGQVFRTPWWPRRDTALNNTVISLGNAKPAWFLPVIGVNRTNHPNPAPFVMYPGTFVGVLNDRDHSGIAAAHRAQSPSILVPASQQATYTLTYSAKDLATDEFGGTYDIDETGGETIVAASGLATQTIAAVRPLGVVQDCVLAEQYFRKYRNLNYAYPNWNILSQGKELRIPVVTADEQDIRPGDRVMISDTAGSWDPATPLTSTPGRLKKVNEAGAYSQEAWVVGRCVARQRIAAQVSVSANQLLLSAVAAGNVSAGTLNQAEGYHTLRRVQTVPGLGLQGSGTGGVPHALLFALADGDGAFWSIDVALAVSGI